MSDINIDQLANLARLNVAPEEHDKLASSVAEILDYVKKIQQVEIVDNGNKINDLKVVRDDVVDEFPNSALIAAFSGRQGDLLKAPTIDAKENSYDA